MKKKYCPKCGKELEITLFYRNAAQFDGLSPYCKVCWSEHNKEQHAKKRVGLFDKRRVQEVIGKLTEG